MTLATKRSPIEPSLTDWIRTNGNAWERNQTPLDPLRGTLNPQNTGLFSTPEIPSARSGCYTGETPTTAAAGHDPPKLKLQRIGWDRYWAARSTKHSNPIPKQMYGKTWGAKNSNPDAKSSDLRKSNSICYGDLSSNRVRWPNRTGSGVRPLQTHRCGSSNGRPSDPELYRKKRCRA